jgi:sugar phosphate permease
MCLFLIPRVVMRGLNGHWPLMWTLTAIGACQGPLMPGKAALQQAWLPKGVERVWATRFMSLGGRLAQLVAVAMTPRISSDLGWRYVCYIYGAVTASFAAVWHLLVTNAPPGGSIRGGRASPPLDAQSPAEQRQQQDSDKAVDWRIFRMRSVQAIVASHIAFNNSNVTLDTWSFVYFKNIFGIDEVSAGRMFSVPLTLSSILGNVVAGVGESLLQKRGVPLLRIRKAMSWAANLMQGGAVLLFGLSPSPSLALVGYFFLRLGAYGQRPTANHHTSLPACLPACLDLCPCACDVVNSGCRTAWLSVCFCWLHCRSMFPWLRLQCKLSRSW